jgi:hypothetical protein
MIKEQGIHFLYNLEKIHNEVYNVNQNELKSNYPVELENIGRYLSTLHDISSCVDGCRGGDHVFEYLTGRSFNLGYATYLLILNGYYDESLNQVRSLAELANLLSLFVCNPSSIEEWKNSNKRERSKKFKPMHVRNSIASNNGILIVDAATYSQLCEISTHVTPQTIPNKHTDDNRPRVGGFHQSEGIKLSLNYLETTLFCIATAFCKFFDHEERFEYLTESVS